METKRQLIQGTFIERVNRFAALVDINGSKELVHVTNSGRMKELLTERASVFLTEEQNRKRKTAYDLVMVNHQGILVSIDSRIPNKLFFHGWQNNLLVDFAVYSQCFPEVNYGDSRLDFLLKGGSNTCFVEVKSVTLVDVGRALFPDAPTERGKRHLEELINAKKEGMRAVIIFVVQREDSIFFAPHDEMDRDFGNTLRQAREKGVEVQAYNCQVTKENISLKEQIPVIL